MSGSGAPTEIAGADTGAASAMSPPPPNLPLVGRRRVAVTNVVQNIWSELSERGGPPIWVGQRLLGVRRLGSHHAMASPGVVVNGTPRSS